jgi:uncharacterized protein (DUF488 family)
MLRREKVVLGLLENLGPSVEKLRLVKLVFLSSKETSIPENVPFYEFVPYRYGPFSFTLYHEIAGLAESGMVRDDGPNLKLVERKKAKEEIASLRPDVRSEIGKILDEYAGLSTRKLLKVVYRKFPWYATRSKIADKELARESRVVKPAVYTIGYEGRSFDGFFNLLLRKGIERLVDVRKNAYSRKYGFVSSILESTCRKLDIEYIHIPELGIPASLRKNLKDKASYRALLERYENEILPPNQLEIDRVVELFTLGPSTLLCFESDPEMCHRSRLAKRVSESTDLRVVNL